MRNKKIINRNIFNTYYYDLFQNTKEDKDVDFSTLMDFINDKEEEKIYFFEVMSSQDYYPGFKLIYNDKNIKVFESENLILDHALCDCMTGSIYVMQKSFSRNDFLKYRRTIRGRNIILKNMLAIIMVNDIYECSLETIEKYKLRLIKLVKLYGDSEKKIITNWYKDPKIIDK